MKILSRHDILSFASTKLCEIEVPEWGGSVQFKPMTMIERRQIRENCMVTLPDKEGNMTTTVDNEKLELVAIINCVMDPSDPKRPLFAEDDLPILEEQMAAGPLSTIAQAILKASGFLPDAVDKSKIEIEKGS